MSESTVRPYEPYLLAAVDAIEAEWLRHWAHYGYTTDRYRKAAEAIRGVIEDMRRFPRYDGVEEYDFWKPAHVNVPVLTATGSGGTRKHLTPPPEPSTTTQCPENPPLDMTWLAAIL